jgi:hypothetical protein
MAVGVALCRSLTPLIPSLHPDSWLTYLSQNDVRTFEAHTEAQLEQEKTARIALEDRLGQQERELDDTREELGTERHQRQNAENQLMKEKMRTRELEKNFRVKTWQCGMKRSASPSDVSRSVKRGKRA